jgi:hypothetical protein
MEPTAADYAATEQIGLIGVVVYLVILIFMIITMWKIYSKAGEPGWACIVPFYNAIVYFKITDRPWWWLILLFIPFVNFVIMIIMYFDMAKSFGHGVGFGFGLLFLGIIFFPILAFGSSTYTGREAQA